MTFIKMYGNLTLFIGDVTLVSQILLFLSGSSPFLANPLHFLFISIFFTEAFRVRDKDQTGTITIGFEDFLTVALGCSM